MIELLRTTSHNTDFQNLVALLDADLAERDGEEHGFYHQFNGIEGLDRVVVAYFEGIPVSCGALKYFDKQNLEIKRMYTLPDYRGKGVAGRILGELEAWTTADGFSYCVLETGKRNPEALGLYKKYGYREIPNFGPYIGIENSVCFRKRLVKKQIG
jgi:GNAT superfamily N-acetyltransferase